MDKEVKNMQNDISFVYEYSIELINKNALKENNKFIIYFKNNKILLNKNIFVFGSLKKLSVRDISSMISGTQGIYCIRGEFAND